MRSASTPPLDVCIRILRETLAEPTIPFGVKICCAGIIAITILCDDGDRAEDVAEARALIRDFWEHLEAYHD
jgi:hypothetical protein